MFDKNLFNSPIIQETFKTEQKAYTLFRHYYPSYTLIETDKDKTATVDAIIVRDGTMDAVVETKTRNTMTLEQLQGPYNNQVLMLKSKIDNGRRLAQLLKTKFVVFYYLKADNVLLSIPVSDHNGKLLTNIEYVEKVLGHTSISAETSKQWCIMLDASNAKIIKGFKSSDAPG